MMGKWGKYMDNLTFTLNSGNKADKFAAQVLRLDGKSTSMHCLWFYQGQSIQGEEQKTTHCNALYESTLYQL